MTRRLAVLAVLIGTCLLAIPAPALACTHGVVFGEVGIECHEGAKDVKHYLADPANQTYVYRLAQDCKGKGDSGVCRNPKKCVSSEGTRGTLYLLLRRAVGGGTWETVMNPCLTAQEASGIGVITPAMVARAMRRLTWPKAELTIEPPDGQTLVNFDTNFFTTNTRPTTQTVTLLGQRVTIEARPVRYRWHFGDGASKATTSPGHRYPRLDVTHDYQEVGHVECSVDTTYAGRYRVNNDGWQQIPGTLTVSGESVPLRVRSASVVLTG